MTSLADTPERGQRALIILEILWPTWTGKKTIKVLQVRLLEISTWNLNRFQPWCSDPALEEAIIHFTLGPTLLALMKTRRTPGQYFITKELDNPLRGRSLIL